MSIRTPDSRPDKNLRTSLSGYTRQSVLREIKSSTFDYRRIHLSVDVACIDCCISSAPNAPHTSPQIIRSKPITKARLRQQSLCHMPNAVYLISKQLGRVAANSHVATVQKGLTRMKVKAIPWCVCLHAKSIQTTRCHSLLDRGENGLCNGPLP